MSTQDLTREKIITDVIGVLADRLVLEIEEIELKSGLIEDLGADSLDFLDIIFSLERKFSIKLRDANLDKFLKAEFTEESLTPEGYILPENIKRLQEFIPGLADKARLTPAQVFRFIDVESMVMLVERKVGATSV